MVKLATRPTGHTSVDYCYSVRDDIRGHALTPVKDLRGALYRRATVLSPLRIKKGPPMLHHVNDAAVNLHGLANFARP